VSKEEENRQNKYEKLTECRELSLLTNFLGLQLLPSYKKDQRKSSMNILKKNISTPLLGIFLFLLFACTPEIGSDEWCVNMKEKSKADWTASEAADFAKHCILK